MHDKTSKAVLLGESQGAQRLPAMKSGLSSRYDWCKK